MIFRQIVFVACYMFTALAAGAQVQSAAPQTEQVETGTLPANLAYPANDLRELKPVSMLHYRIRLLPISSFPQLPAQVSQQLMQKGCMIPQTYEAHEPENVIHGSFEKRGSSDWAVLCSIDQVTTLYVFFQSDFANPIPLRHQPDSEWLGVEWSLDYGSAWGISTMHADAMPRLDQADHDGIEDAFVEQSATVHYFKNGRWTTIDVSQ